MQRLLQASVSSASQGLLRRANASQSLTVDCAIVSEPGKEPAQLLLIRRKHDPFQDRWALPGGFVDEGETLDQAAARELQEETSVNPASVLLKQVGAFGDPGRDPRGWTVTVAYVALVPNTEDLAVQAADDAADAKWFSVFDLPPLAFDHKLVVRTCFERLAELQRQSGAAASQGGLLDDLRRGAANLEGPWQ